MELAILWSPTNVQWMLVLVDIDADYSLIYGNLDKFLGRAAYTDGYGGRSVKEKPVSLYLCTLALAAWFPTYTLCMSPLYLNAFYGWTFYMAWYYKPWLGNSDSECVW